MDDYIIIKNAMLEDGTVTDVVVKKGKIVSVGKTTTMSDVLDLCGKRLLPGLIDIHTHGCLGFDTMEGNLSEMSKFHKKNGVTSFLPTTMTMPISEIEKATESIPERAQDEAKIMGFHMEGPFIAESRRGAQNIDFIAEPDINILKKCKNIKMVTLAPELDGAMDFILGVSKINEGGNEETDKVVVSIGHTDCSYDTAKEAFSKGATCLTHTFNAMPALLHREPGPIGAALTQGAYAQIICDGLHIHPAAVLAAYRMFGAERMILISDSIRATGLCDGEYSFGGQKMTVNDGVARVEGGALAGGTATLYECVMKAIEFGIPAKDAFRMASETPANLMGWKKGRIEVGYDAEFIVLDSEYKLLDTLIIENKQLD